MAVPQLELTVSYSVGVKANIGNYESADAHLSRTEKYDVSELDSSEIDQFYTERFLALRDELSVLAQEEYKEMKS